MDSCFLIVCYRLVKVVVVGECGVNVLIGVWWMVIDLIMLVIGMIG